jgi:delta 1-pyrroline-5-carboxylate dehydrogenase
VTQAKDRARLGEHFDSQRRKSQRPWNFPMFLSHRSIAPALALGNAAVVKPAAETPVTGGLLLAKIYEEAGLPPGLLNVVIGPISEIGDLFTTHPIPRLISFTGSTRVGRHIGALAMQAPQLKRVALELGGNAPLRVPSGKALPPCTLSLSIAPGPATRFREGLPRAGLPGRRP